MKKLMALTLVLMTIMAVLTCAAAETHRNWDAVAPLPSRQTLDACRPDGRAPYVTFFPSLPSGGFTEFSVDFRADYQPAGTYLSPFSWWLDLSGLKKQYRKVEDQGISGYSGFQRLQDGRGVAIMTLWNVYCTDKNGRVTAIRPRVIYAPGNAEIEALNDGQSGEGDFTHVLIPYDWKAGRTYRMLMQLGTVEENGNVKVLMYVQDLTTGYWTHLADFDSGMKNVWFRNCCAFLEDFSWPSDPAIRTMELSNIRVYGRKAQKWQTITKGEFSTQYDHKGCYVYGADDTTFWCLTTGVQNAWKNPGKKTLSVKRGEQGCPY